MDMLEAFERGDFLQIIESADKASGPEDQLLLGISLYKLGKHRDAMKVFLKLSDIVRDLAQVFYYMALIHKDKGDMDSARSCIDNYSHFYPDDEDALEILESDQEPTPLVSVPSLELAKIYAAQGHFAQSLEIFADLLKESPLNPDVRKEAERIQTMHVIKTLERWLERIKK